MIVEPFRIHVDDDVLGDLRRRILGTRWPEPEPRLPAADIAAFFADL
jgi:hypothetical protein